jgi:uncharacterized protein with GYD domain
MKGGTFMPTYITLVRFTEKGITNIKQSPARIEGAKQAFRSAGAELKQWFLVMGQYDVVTIVEAPNDETMARLSLSIGSLGNVRIETLRAFTEDEFRKMIATMP